MRTMPSRFACAVAILMSLCLGSPGCCVSEVPPDDAGFRAEFDTRCRTWMVALDVWMRTNPLSSYTPILPEERKIIAMGPRTVPFIIEMLEEDLWMTALDECTRANTLLAYPITLPKWSGMRATDPGAIPLIVIEEILEEEA